MTNIFLKSNDPRLKQTAQEIPKDQISSKGTLRIIETMLKVAYGQQKDQQKPIMVGLAAPQIGIPKRIILVDIKTNGKGPPATQAELSRRYGRGKIEDLRVYINPEVTWFSKGEQEWYEGCYSTGRICGIVSRPISIKIQAFTTSFPHSMWERRVEKFIGYTARIFQHEIDHLDGKVFINHITDPDKLHWVEESEFHLYRNKQAWRNWPKKHPYPLLKVS